MFNFEQEMRDAVSLYNTQCTQKYLDSKKAEKAVDELIAGLQKNGGVDYQAMADAIEYDFDPKEFCKTPDFWRTNNEMECHTIENQNDECVGFVVYDTAHYDEGGGYTETEFEYIAVYIFTPQQMKIINM